MQHDLEKLFNAPSEDIMDAIMNGFRAQVDVKGKLAELYLYKYLTKLEEKKIITDLVYIFQINIATFNTYYCDLISCHLSVSAPP